MKCVQPDACATVHDDITWLNTFTSRFVDTEPLFRQHARQNATLARQPILFLLDLPQNEFALFYYYAGNFSELRFEPALLFLMTLAGDSFSKRAPTPAQQCQKTNAKRRA